NLGLTTGQWGYGDQSINTGSDQGVHIPFFNSSDERSDWAVLWTGHLKDEPSARSFSIKFRDGTPDITNYRPWVKISTESGYCSVVDSNPGRRSIDFENPFR